MTMKIDSRRSGNVEILDLNGRLVLGEGTSELREAIRNLISDGRTLILINLAKVPYIDSAGIGELVSSFAAVEKQKGSLKLLNLAKGVHGVLQMTKLLTVFEVYENEQTAVKSFA
jgi:anti-sigma B factor antagonist